jgi:flagellar biosynthetic protein FliQ
MTDGALVELVRQAIVAGLIAIAPVLVTGLAVGTLMGIMQAATGVHEPIVGLVPRLVAMAIVLLLTLPWMVERLAELLRVTAGGP